MTDIDRRSFLIGAAAAIASPVLPVVAIEADPLVHGFTHQSWLFDEPRPEFSWKLQRRFAPAIYLRRSNQTNERL